MTPTLQQELSRLEGSYPLGARKEQRYYKYPFMSGAAVSWSIFFGGMLLMFLPFVVIALLAQARDFHPDIAFFILVAVAAGLVTWMIWSVVHNVDRHEVSASYEQGNAHVLCKGTRIRSGALTYWDETGIASLKYKASGEVRRDLVRWDEIASIWDDIRLHSNVDDGNYTTIRYRLQRHDGSLLPRVWTSYIALFKERTLPLLLPPALAAYQGGQLVRFGPLSLSQAGLAYKERTLPWEECEGIALDKANGVVSIHSARDQRGVLVRRAYETLSQRVEISPRDQKLFRRKPWARIPCSEAPNLAVLDALLQETRGTGLGEPLH
jgi:hypothetical protein